MKAASALLLGLGLAAAAAPALAAAGPDELWEVTSKMDDKVSGMVMPGTTMRVCQRKMAKSEEMVPMEKDCKMLDQKVSGSKVSFRFECRGEMKMSGSGEFDRPNADSYSGRMQMQGSTEGHKMNMTSSFTGKRVGSCTFGEPPQIVSGPGARGGMQGMPAGMDPEMMKQLKNNPQAREAMRKMYGQ